MRYILVICLAVLAVLAAILFFSNEPEDLTKISSDRFHIEVSLKEQKVKVYLGDATIKSFPCSAAKDGQSTPVGEYKTYENIAADSVKIDGEKIDFYYLTRFKGHLGFHSKIHGNHPLVAEGEELFREGRPSSMGCIRLEDDDAKWIYSLPLGIKVHIREN